MRSSIKSLKKKIVDIDKATKAKMVQLVSHSRVKESLKGVQREKGHLSPLQSFY